MRLNNLKFGRDPASHALLRRPKALSLTAFLLGVALSVTGCLPADTTPAGGQGQVALFYIVNQTSREINVRVLADGDPLFSVSIGSAVFSSGEGRELPPRGGFPAKEIKVWMSSIPNELEVDELITNRFQRLKMTGASGRSGLRCKITVTDDGIQITQNYVPIR
jgi:hypothetical protein